MKDWQDNILCIGIGLIIVISLIMGFFPNSTNDQTTDQATTRSSEQRIQDAQAELEKIKQSRTVDGKTGKLHLSDINNPQVVLPVLIALLKEELTFYGIDYSEILAQIKTHPEQFRKKVPEHWRKRFLILDSPNEQKVGAQVEQEFKSKNKIYSHPKTLALLNQIAKKLAAQLPIPVTPKIYLFEDDYINAFALPNGTILVTSGLVNFIKSKDELAAVLAHEYGHIASQHGNEQITKVLFFMAGGVVVDNEIKKMDLEKQLVHGTLIEQIYTHCGKIGSILPFSRKMESEADRLGIRYMARAGFDPRAAITFHERLLRVYKDETYWQNFLSTHPTGEKRVRKLKAEYEKLNSIPKKRLWNFKLSK